MNLKPRYRVELTAAVQPEPGDVVVEHPCRGGERWWLIEDVREGRRWATFLVRELDYTEAVAAIIDADRDGNVWTHHRCPDDQTRDVP